MSRRRTGESGLDTVLMRLYLSSSRPVYAALSPFTPDLQIRTTHPRCRHAFARARAQSSGPLLAAGQASQPSIWQLEGKVPESSPHRNTGTRMEAIPSPGARGGVYPNGYSNEEEPRPASDGVSRSSTEGHSRRLRSPSGFVVRWPRIATGAVVVPPPGSDVSCSLPRPPTYLALCPGLRSSCPRRRRA